MSADKLVEAVAAKISAKAYAAMRAQGFSGGWDHDEFAAEIAQAAIDAIFPEDTPTLAARLVSELDTDESESPVDYRPGDYNPRVEVAKYVIGRIRGEVE